MIQSSRIPSSRSAISPGLMLVHGNQPEALRDLLVEWMRRTPLAPLEREVLLVQSNGIAQWLKLALAAEPAAQGGGCGIAAGLDFLLPSRFLWQVYRAVLGEGAVPESSPFDKARLVWRLMRLLPDVLGERACAAGASSVGTSPAAASLHDAAADDVFQPLRRFLHDDGDGRKRFQLAERLADLFDQYQVYRADWLAAWAAGDDVLPDAQGRHRPLPDGQAWQPALWRALLADVAATGGASAVGHGRAAVHEAFLERAESLGDDARPPGLPRRVLVFGISSLPRQSLEVLAALARWSQVLMCVHNPCAHYWADIVADKDLLRAVAGRHAQRPGRPQEIPDEALHLHAHPLLAAWGKQGRDFIALLDERDDPEARGRYQTLFRAFGRDIDVFAPHADDSLLHQLQNDILELRPLHETQARGLGVDPACDASLRFHIAHSAQREVEILHDQLLAAFDADASLRPRDVIVMVPDIDAYAPHIRAVFGLHDRDDPRHIPFSIADQGRRGFDPLVNALERLLALPQSRVAVSDVLDLLEVPALRRRFAIDESDLPLLHRWIRGANIRWGLHGEQRASLDLPAEVEAAPHSWLFGLRRMLLGYAVGEGGEAWQEIEPYDEVGGLDAARLGPLLLLLEQLDEAWRTLRQPATPDAWCVRLRALCAAFFAADGDADAFTLLQLDEALADWQAACAEAAFDAPLPLPVVVEHWLTALEGGGLSQRFFAGAVTFATLMPMRAIPFRRVCLLGMNDGDYPRSRRPADFDLMGRDYRPGDRSRREDDRYLFLEALLSARDHLHVSWVGRSITDNTPRPPSVLVAQLRDHIAAGWRLAGEGAGTSPDALMDALTVAHPLQPFGSAYFGGAGAHPALFTYAAEWRAPAAVAGVRRGEGEGAGTGADAHDADHVSALRLPPRVREEPLSLAELTEFLTNPVKAFFRQRLDVVFADDAPTAEDVEPFALDGLARWQLQDALIAAERRALELGGDPLDARAACLASIRRRGELAGGAFGDQLAAHLVEPLDDLFARYARACAAWPERLAHPVELEHVLEHVFEDDAGRPPAGGCRIVLHDWLDGLFRDPEGRLASVVLDSSELIRERRYRHDKLLRHWLRHLALQRACGPVVSVVIGKIGDVSFAPLAPAEAAARLDDLLAAWAEGLRAPLPLPPLTAFAWLARMPAMPDGMPAETSSEAERHARLAYEGDGHKNEGECARSPYLRRAYPDFASLCADGRFATHAERLLRPLTLATPANAAGKGGEGRV